MLLARLVEYERRKAKEDLDEEVVSVGYFKTQVMGLVELDAEGRLLSYVPTVTQEGRRRRGLEITAPHVRRTSGIAAKLLADKADYALGVTDEGASENEKRKVALRHEKFVTLVRECGRATQERAVMAALRFLESPQLGELQQSGQIPPNDVVTFRVSGQYVTDLLKVKQFWAMRGGDKAASKGQCLVCGGTMRIARVHAIPIKRIPGGQPSGTALVSFNKPAFESYGLTQSYNAPVCEECAELYTKGLNRLITGEDTSLVIRPVIYVFWARDRAPAFSVARLLRDPEPQQVRALLDAARRGGPPAEVEVDAFYSMGLSASGGRAVVRDWLESTVGEVQNSVVRYFRHQHIAPLYGQEPRPFSIFSLAYSLVPPRRGPQREKPPANAAIALLHVALAGRPMPDWLLYQAVKRNRVEQGVSWARAALIKLALQSQDSSIEPNEEGTMDTKTQESPAYLCGRLLAILERVQWEAVRPKATLVDRFYGAASSAPASVFGNLLRNAQSHLAKVRRDKPGLHKVLQDDLGEVMSKLCDFPRTLTMRDQAVFALGYYYQRAARWRREDEQADTAAQEPASEA